MALTRTWHASITVEEEKRKEKLVVGIAKRLTESLKELHEYLVSTNNNLPSASHATGALLHTEVILNSLLDSLLKHVFIWR